MDLPLGQQSPLVVGLPISNSPSSWKRAHVCVRGSGLDPLLLCRPVHWRAHPFSAGWGLNIEFEPSFGGKSRWRVRLQTGVLNICLPNNRVRVWATPYTFDSRLPGPAARKPVTGNADRSRKMRLGNGLASCDSQCARPSSAPGAAC